MTNSSNLYLRSNSPTYSTLSPSRAVWTRGCHFWFVTPISVSKILSETFPSTRSRFRRIYLKRIETSSTWSGRSLTLESHETEGTEIQSLRSIKAVRCLSLHWSFPESPPLSISRNRYPALSLAWNPLNHQLYVISSPPQFEAIKTFGTGMSLMD